MGTDIHGFAEKRSAGGWTLIECEFYLCDPRSYSVKRLNGLIGKMHTELATPGRVTDVVGLRGRGETFVGQTDTGSLQIVVNEDAPLGQLL